MDRGLRKEIEMRGIFYPSFVSGRGAFGLLVLRLVTGAAFIFHGWPKIQNAFHWMDRENAPSPVPDWLQALAAVSEFGGGIALILGFLTLLAALGIGCTMVAALAMVHIPNGDPFVASKPGQSSFEPAAVYLAIMILLLLIGPGILSLDALLFRPRFSPNERPWSQLAVRQ
jgi:putative oxidoreductase